MLDQQCYNNNNNNNNNNDNKEQDCHKENSHSLLHGAQIPHLVDSLLHPI